MRPLLKAAACLLACLSVLGVRGRGEERRGRDARKG